jgi:hypothetical protein
MGRALRATVDLGRRAIAARESGLLLKQVAYNEGVSIPTLKRAIRNARPEPDHIRNLMRRGLDTQQIARMFHANEATIYNMLARLSK